MRVLASDDSRICEAYNNDVGATEEIVPGVEALLGGVKIANLALRFILELCALVALGYWGFKAGGGSITKLALGIGAPLLVAVVWGTFLAPHAAVAEPSPLRLVLELGVFGSAAPIVFVVGALITCTGLVWLGVALMSGRSGASARQTARVS